MHLGPRSVVSTSPRTAACLERVYGTRVSARSDAGRRSLPSAAFVLVHRRDQTVLKPLPVKPPDISPTCRQVLAREPDDRGDQGAPPRR